MQGVGEEVGQGNCSGSKQLALTPPAQPRLLSFDMSWVFSEFAGFREQGNMGDLPLLSSYS